jgi:hypothetical protein
MSEQFLNLIGKQKYHIVRTVHKSNRKTIDTEVTSVPLTHKYMTTYLPDLLNAIQ